MESPRLKVGILGATGSVGQKFVRLLDGHPWFEITALAASERSAGKTYGEAAQWLEAEPIPESVAGLTVGRADIHFEGDCDFVFSALDSSVARDVEPAVAAKGYGVVSNASAYRQHPKVPLLIPEINPEHTALIGHQDFGPGFITTNPNCSTTGLTASLKPLEDRFGVREVHAVTMQAISGAGYPGVPSLDILGNVVPYIPNEEDKLESEPQKILGRYGEGRIERAPMVVSAQVNRVPVIDGHLVAVSVKLAGDPGLEEVRAALDGFESPLLELDLPSAPRRLVQVLDQPAAPQPRLHADLGRGMTVSVGQLRTSPLGGFRYVTLVHNTVRGAAGGALLNAELLVRQGHLRPRSAATAGVAP